MGKTKKLGKLGAPLSRPGPLADQISRDELARPSGRVKIRGNRKDGDDEFVEGHLSSNILKQSLAQLQELEDEVETEVGPIARKGGPQPEYRQGARNIKLDEDDESDEDPEDVDETIDAVPQNVEKVVKEFESEMDIAKMDLDILEHFMNKDAGPQKKLADIFKDKITEKKTEIKSQIDAESVQTVDLSPEVQEMCKDMGKVLAKYRSGPLPKMFKIIPKMRSWEDLVYMTDPEKWSAAAMYQAVRIFVSNLKESMAQRFFNLVLLPRVRDDIAFYKRLNYHLYQALCKALFKPAAFFKGVLLPLCTSGNCSLREAIIIGSVLAKNHIPVLHSCAAVLKIAEMDYSGANSIFLRVFFDKKYALPYRVVDACVYHFIKFQHDRRELPVLWHQALLTFIQRYKEDLSQDQKDSIMEVTKVHSHYAITPEVRRELQFSKCREDSVMAAED